MNLSYTMTLIPPANSFPQIGGPNPLAPTGKIKGLAKMLILFYFQLDDLLDDCGGTEGFDPRWCGTVRNKSGLMRQKPRNQEAQYYGKNNHLIIHQMVKIVESYHSILKEGRRKDNMTK